MARFLIADDNDQIRSSISDIIHDEGGVVCGSFADGKTAVEMAAELKPDIVILDLRMPLLDGISAGRAIRAFLPNVFLVLYTMFASPYLEAEVTKLGFHAVVQKSDTQGLVAALRSAVSAVAPLLAKGESEIQANPLPSTS